jgi:hypothetical protein
MLARMLEQAEGSPTPWEQLVLLIFADIVTTWNFDRQIEPAFESQEVSETALPGGNASMIFAMMAAAGADLQVRSTNRYPREAMPSS